MKSNRSDVRIAALAGLLLLSMAKHSPITSTALAYELATHRDISRSAASQSTLVVPATLARFGLRPLPIDDGGQAFKSSRGERLSIVDLIRTGAAWEDNLSVFQPLRHFYDPANDRALDLGGSIGVAFSIKSADWALEDVGTYNGSPGPMAVQGFSYGDGRDRLYEALTLPTETLRRNAWGLMFQTLGHVMHHLQDMAQPQHVRNDPHCDKDVCGWLASVLNLNQLHAPSPYELYTDLDAIRTNLPSSGSGASPVYPGNDLSTNTFGSPRRFWRTTSPGSDISQGKGIAEYTNRNFYSAGSLTSYASPPPPQGLTQYFSPTESRDISELLPGTTLRGTVRFWSSEVTDALAGGPPVTNPRAFSEGLLDSDLAQYYSTAGPGYLVYALNRFTFDAAHQFLIPRAVAYSAGLINFFFRGELEISLPDEGVYGIIDHNIAANSSASTGGFPKLKVKLRNVTPAGTDGNGQPLVEPIPNATGSLVAVVKFHRNLCYQPDLSGEYGSPGIDWSVCRSPTEEIVVSQPVAVPAGINSAPQPVTFTFANRIPASATDLYLQVVYRGPLGEESDAVVVATKDISEPRYISHYVRWDQYTYAHYPSVDAGPYTWAEWCAQGGYASLDACNRAEGQVQKAQYSPTASPIAGYDPSSPLVPPNTWTANTEEPPLTPVMTLPAPVGTLARVAVLTDANPTNLVVVVTEWGVSASSTPIFMWITGIAAATRNQRDPESGTLIPSVTYLAGRGVYLPAEENFLLTSGTAASIPDFVLGPSQINF